MIVPRTVDQQIIKRLKKWDLSGCGNAHSFARGGGIQIKAGCSKAAQLSSRHGGQGWTELSLSCFLEYSFQGEGGGGVGVAGRARVSTWPMISVDEAQKMVLDQVGSRSKLMLMMSLQCSAMMREESGVMVLATEMVDFRSSLGRVLCQEVIKNRRLGSI